MAGVQGAWWWIVCGVSFGSPHNVYGILHELLTHYFSMQISLRAAISLFFPIILLCLPVFAAASTYPQLVNVASDGTPGTAPASLPSLSADGRYVAFASGASNLVNGDTNGTADVFVHDMITGSTTLVSVASDGTQGDDSSWGQAISAGGRYITFSARASNLVPDDINGHQDIFVHDMVTGSTALASIASDGTQADGDPYYYSAISNDGRYIAFSSTATNLVPDDTNGQPDIFVHDMLTGSTTRVSVASDGSQGNYWSDS